MYVYIYISFYVQSSYTKKNISFHVQYFGQKLIQLLKILLYKNDSTLKTSQDDIVSCVCRCYLRKMTLTCVKN